MSDTGVLVTDAEIAAVIPALSGGLNDRAKFIVKAVEKLVKRYCHQDFVLTTYTDDPHDLNTGELKYAGMPAIDRKDFMLNHAPVTTFTSIKQVVTRNATTGAPLETYTIPRDSYYVDLTLGVVSLIKYMLIYTDATLMNMGVVTSWPEGKGVLLCTYIAGYSSIDFDLKMAVLQIIDRWYHMTSQQLWHLQSASGELGSETPIRPTRGLTADEMLLLNPFVRNKLF